MKKYCWLLLLVLIPLIVWATDGVNTVEHPAVVNGVTTPDKVNTVTGLAASASYPDITFWLNFEENDNSGDYNMGSSECSDGDTSGAYNGAAVVNTDAALVGTYGLDCPTSYDWMDFDVSSGDIVSGVAGRIGFKIRFVAWTAYMGVFRVYEDAQNVLDLYKYGNDGVGTRELVLRLEVDDAQSALITTTAADLELNTTYFVEVKYDTTGNSYEILINGVSKGTDTTDKGPIEPAALHVGDPLGQSGDYHLDNFMISTDPTRDFYGTGLHDDTTKPSGACNG